MISFLLKGILRDKSRSVLPVIIVALGVALTVFLSGYLRGVMDDITDQNARFETGHVKVLTRAYAENQDQMPLDLGILGVDSLIQVLHRRYPEMIWVKRIRFGGIMDVPDVQRNSRVPRRTRARRRPPRGSPYRRRAPGRRGPRASGRCDCRRRRPGSARS